MTGLPESEPDVTATYDQTQTGADDDATTEPEAGGYVGDPEDPGTTAPGTTMDALTVDHPGSGSRVTEREWPAIAGYEILGLLGRGGMGRVYRARQVNLQRLVALKVILAGDDSEAEQVARFREEARAIARLRHPNIVQIYEVGESDGHPFIALELVEGGSLAEHLRGTPTTAARAARLVETLARAVHVAHQQGVIHRDLKPSNILLDPPDFLGGPPGSMDGWVPKITDFGLAKKRDESSDLTVSGVVMGTPGYMAPEQADGRTRDIGPAADIYALGVILYELLTGRTPFRGTTMEILDQVRHAPPTPPRRLEPEVPAPLETICLKCLEKDPGRRYGSASALAADLKCFLEDKPILARPVGPLDRLALWSRRNRAWIVGAIVLAAAVLLTWFGAVRWQTHRREEQDRERAAKEREWKDYQEARSKEQFEKLLAEGPSAWPMPAEERFSFQNGLHDLQVRRNRASLRDDAAEIKAVEVQLRRAEPLLRRLQADLTQAELAGLQLPAVASARSAANRARSTNNLKQLALAAHNYANVHGGLLLQPAIYGKDGRPLLSWRVALLPYLEQSPLYRKFHMDEPWDSPHNIALLKYIPPPFIPPEENASSPAHTTYYQVFVGTKGPVGPMFEPTPDARLRLAGGCPDGASSTILIVEADTAVPWTKPEDLSYDPAKPLPKLGGLFKDGFAAAFLDGSVRFITRDADEEMIRSLITRNGDEPIEWSKLK
jgi:hypothetical protein